MGMHVELEGITKTFAGVTVLDTVSLSIEPGTVHALVGENGAGKSTLIKILSGIHQPDSGAILIDGEPVHLANVKQAESHGIATIHQELNLVPRLSVAENILLGRQPRRYGLLSRAATIRAARPWLSRVGLDIDPATPVGELGIAHRQLIEIVKALSLESQVLILDEPTATLTGVEIARLLDVMRQLRDEGVGQVFISHHLDEIPQIADTITVLRDGKTVGRLPADAPQRDVIRLMVGREIDEQYPARASSPSTQAETASSVVPAPPALEVSSLTSDGRFTDVSFTVQPGEIVGLVGLVGAGRTEVLRAIFGADRYSSGTVLINGTPLKPHDIAGAISAGLALVSEDRKGQGLATSQSVVENFGYAAMPQHTRLGLVDKAAQRRQAEDLSRRLKVRMRSLDQPVGTLSGGNQQKVVIGKWLAAGSTVLLLDEPTRGVDVGARVEIYELINAVAERGGAVVIVSSELPEALGMADRLYVMSSGRITGELTAERATQEAVMELAVMNTEAVL